MKKTIGTLLVTIVAIVCLHSFRASRDSAVTGKVIPPDGVEYIWAISGTDTLKTTATEGAFSLTLKPGTYKIVVDAKDPYQDAVIDPIEIKDGQNTDLGEIRLQQ